MLKKALFIFICFACFFVHPAIAEQRYNAMEDRWETIPDGSDWEVRYNAMEDNWSYQPPDAEVEYNPFSDHWDWDSGHGNRGGKRHGKCAK